MSYGHQQPLAAAITAISYQTRSRDPGAFEASAGFPNPRRGRSGMQKWVVDPHGDDSDSDEAALPQPKAISRAALAAPDFTKESFLIAHADYRSLREVQNAVREWETKLHAELYDLVNASFDDFVGAVDSVQAGEPSLGSVRSELHKFARMADTQAGALDQGARALSLELKNNKQLARRELEAARLTYMFDLLAELEAAVPETDLADTDSIVVLAKMCVAMLVVAQDLKAVKAVQVLRISLDSVSSELLAKIEEALGGSESRLALLEAHERLREHIRLRASQ